MHWAQSTKKDYIRAENKFQSISSLFIPEVIIPQVSFAKITTQILSTESKPRKTIAHALEPIKIPRALNIGTCIEQGDLFYFADLHSNRS